MFPLLLHETRVAVLPLRVAPYSSALSVKARRTSRILDTYNYHDGCTAAPLILWVPSSCQGVPLATRATECMTLFFKQNSVLLPP
jgi:hypothetical protein